VQSLRRVVGDLIGLLFGRICGVGDSRRALFLALLGLALNLLAAISRRGVALRATRLRTARLGCTRLRTARLGFTRLCTARLGVARLGLARLDITRLRVTVVQSFRRLIGGLIGLLFGSIAGLVDCFDALTHPRPYGETVAPSNALNMLYNWRNAQFDGALIEQFIHCVGIFPVGALVELHSSETGIVIAQNPAMRLMPRVMVVLDARGKPIKPQKIVDRASIKRTLEKGSVPIDTSEFFL